MFHELDQVILTLIEHIKTGKILNPIVAISCEIQDPLSFFPDLKEKKIRFF